VCVCVCVCVYKHTHIWVPTDCIWITVPTKLYCSVTFLYKIGALRSVDWIFIIEAPAWRWLSQYVTLGRTFYNIIFKQEAVSAQITSKFSYLTHSARRTLLELYHNITLNWLRNVIVLWINENNAIINNNNERLQDLILLFEISKVTRKNLFEIYTTFWHAPSKNFASPVPAKNLVFIVTSTYSH
jgi:hypothetical protein